MDQNRSRRDMARYQQPAKGNHSMSRSMNDCSMNHSMERIDQYPVAMAYVPWQKYGETFDLEKGFHTGTIFPELDLPFMRAGCMKR